MGTLRAFATSPMPLTASLNSHSLSGFSGLPKLRQSVMECGLAPTAARFLQTSSTQVLPPRYGSAPTANGLDAVATASPLNDSSTGLSTAASPGLGGPPLPWRGLMTVLALTS